MGELAPTHGDSFGHEHGELCVHLLERGYGIIKRFFGLLWLFSIGLSKLGHGLLKFSLGCFEPFLVYIFVVD